MEQYTLPRIGGYSLFGTPPSQHLLPSCFAYSSSRTIFTSAKACTAERTNNIIVLLIMKLDCNAAVLAAETCDYLRLLL